MKFSSLKPKLNKTLSKNPTATISRTSRTLGISTSTLATSSTSNSPTVYIAPTQVYYKVQLQETKAHLMSTSTRAQLLSTSTKPTLIEYTTAVNTYLSAISVQPQSSIRVELFLYQKQSIPEFTSHSVPMSINTFQVQDTSTSMTVQTHFVFPLSNTTSPDLVVASNRLDLQGSTIEIVLLSVFCTLLVLFFMLQCLFNYNSKGLSRFHRRKSFGSSRTFDL